MPSCAAERRETGETRVRERESVCETWREWCSSNALSMSLQAQLETAEEQSQGVGGVSPAEEGDGGENIVLLR